MTIITQGRRPCTLVRSPKARRLLPGMGVAHNGSRWANVMRKENGPSGREELLNIDQRMVDRGDDRGALSEVDLGPIRMALADIRLGHASL